MKLGLFDHMQKNDKPELTYADLYANHLEIIQFADDAGMDFYFVAEHHFDLGFSECASPGTIIAAASQRTKNIRLGPLVYVLPLWNPIRVAEEVAMLDNLTQGRLECGFGAGIGPFTFAAYGVPWNEKRKMMWEAFRMIKGMWQSPSYSYEGEYFRCKDVEMCIPLVQKPHPPIWMPTRSPESIEEAASTGVSTVQWVPPRMKIVRDAFDRYREVYQRVRPAGQKPRIGLMREIYVAESDQQARDEAKDHWVYFWHRRGGGRTYGGHGHGNLTTLLDGERKKELMDIDHSIAEGSLICGSPETVTRQIREIATQAGADTFLGEFTFGALEHRQVMNSLRLFADQVMPGLRQFEIDALNYPKAESSVSGQTQI
jgi:alkanesulfonate monooxygenase SsuD/methylene tetrahydromethanopterin reductase-like flavin-dependent oxidoreductase (luciferase family)